MVDTFVEILECQSENEGEMADLANFDPRIGCHGQVPQAMTDR